jgi:hypothetical protein
MVARQSRYRFCGAAPELGSATRELLPVSAVDQDKPFLFSLLSGSSTRCDAGPDGQ